MIDFYAKCDKCNDDYLVVKDVKKGDKIDVVILKCSCVN